MSYSRVREVDGTIERAFSDNGNRPLFEDELAALRADDLVRRGSAIEAIKHKANLASQLGEQAIQAAV